MLSITDNYLYVIDAAGRQQIFDVEKLKIALQEAFTSAGNPNGYLAEDIACSVESAMLESYRSDRIFTQSEVDGAVNGILENAGYSNVAQVFRRANSHLYIAVDASVQDANMLILRHLGIQEPAAGKLAEKVVGALKKLDISSASPALYLELARYYEHNNPPVLTTPADKPAEPSGSKILLTAADAAGMLDDTARELYDSKIITLPNLTGLYPNFRLSLNLALLAEKYNVSSPATELEMAPILYDAGERVGKWLNLLCRHLNTETLPLYLVLTKLDIFTERYLGTTYPEGRLAALDMAALFRNALGYPVKKVRCRTSHNARNAN